VRGADGVSTVARERLELRLRQRNLVVRTVRARIERSSLQLERAGAELVVRQEHESLRERELHAEGANGADGRSGAGGARGLDGRPSLVLRAVPPAPALPSALQAASVEGAAPPRTLPVPTAPSPTAAAQLPEPALALLTEQVLRRIERLAVAQRERMGVV
jgi:hypothetical protein